MNVHDTQHTWADANQDLLLAEFARLKDLLKSTSDTNVVEQTEYSDKADEKVLVEQAAIDVLSERFDLSRFERDLLLLLAAVEMDTEFAPLCARASGFAERPWVSFGLALAVLTEPHWSALIPMRPLRRWRLVDTTSDNALVSTRLRIDERVLHYLAGFNYLDIRVQSMMRPVDPPILMANAQRLIAGNITIAVDNVKARLPVIQLCGDDRLGKLDVAALVAAELGLSLYAIAVDAIPESLEEIDALVTLWQRELTLLDSALLIECSDTQPGATALQFITRNAGLTLLATPESATVDRETLNVRIDKPDRQDQLQLWLEVSSNSSSTMKATLERVTQEFRFSAKDIQRIGATLADPADASSDQGSALWQACRDHRRSHLAGLAERIDTLARWDDLVLPESQKHVLAQIASQVRNQFIVAERWGFSQKSSRGLGISVLFSGESGTGKTMAAEVLANELHLELFRIDLSAVVSKYIGETEKNLARVFEAAEQGGSILLFDEADALFGKRSDVRDSHDRYANIEVSYLLQRMESYRGLAILTTNQKASLDSAFLRRLRFVVQFPFPDLTEREAIWRGVFPAATPMHGIDYFRLAQLNMAGGNIRNIALDAAYQAADASQAVSMTHLLRAAHNEAAKRERAITGAETRGWV